MAVLLTTEVTSDPKVKKTLDKLEGMEAYSVPFNDLKEALKDYILFKYEKGNTGWEADWNLEQAIMTWLYGEGHA